MDLYIVRDAFDRISAASAPRLPNHARVTELSATEGDRAVPPRALVHAAADRIHLELELLRSRGATAELRDAGGDPAATIRWGGETYHAFFPPEFPYGAPILLRGELDAPELRPVPLRFGWSSLHHLIDVLGPAAPPGSRRGKIARYLHHNPKAVENLGRYVLGFDVGALLVTLIWTLSR